MTAADRGITPLMRDLFDTSRDRESRGQVFEHLKRDWVTLKGSNSELLALMRSSDRELQVAGLVLAHAHGTPNPELDRAVLESLRGGLVIAHRAMAAEELGNRIPLPLANSAPGKFVEQHFVGPVRDQLILGQIITEYALELLSKSPNAAALLKEAGSFSDNETYQRHLTKAVASSKKGD